jgi:hypothetical protein
MVFSSALALATVFYIQIGILHWRLMRMCNRLAGEITDIELAEACSYEACARSNRV